MGERRKKYVDARSQLDHVESGRAGEAGSTIAVLWLCISRLIRSRVRWRYYIAREW
jgi:hypothetical protein